MSATADQVTAYGTALESRAEVDSLEALHAERRQLMLVLSPLKSRHGSFGTFDAKRKQLLEALKVRARMELTRDGAKVTESAIDTAGHADSQYGAFLDQMESEKIEYLNLDVQLSEIEEKIRNREIALQVYSSELRLAR